MTLGRTEASTTADRDERAVVSLLSDIVLGFSFVFDCGPHIGRQFVVRRQDSARRMQCYTIKYEHHSSYSTKSSGVITPTGSKGYASVVNKYRENQGSVLVLTLLCYF